MTRVETFNNLIDGNWQPAITGETFERRNPANGELIAYYAKSSGEDVDLAVAAAKKAFESWRLYPAPKRGEIIFRAAQMIQDRKEELAREMTEEMGKVITEARGDVQEAIDMAFYMAGEGRRLYGQTTPSELREKFNMSVRRPIGVCGVITPWNFPMAIPSWKILPALVAGNTIVFKPATNTPRSAVRFIEILIEAGIPDGVLNVVNGTGSSVGDAIVDHPDVPLITFTGSNATGTKVAVGGARLGKRVSLELGGKNAVIVLDDADLDLAVDGIVWSAFGTSGQRCTAASRVVAQRGIHRKLVDRLAERTAALRIGDGLDPEVEVGPIVNERQLNRIEEYVGIGQKEGATLVTGGGRATKGGLGKGYFLEPAIFDDVKPGMRIAQEEIFGPVSSIIPVDDLDEAITVVNGVEYGLSAGIFTANVNNAFRAMQDIHTGILYINAGTIGAEIHLPFGGTKGTGNGHREAGTAALDFVTEWQSIYVDYSGKLQRAQIDPVS